MKLRLVSSSKDRTHQSSKYDKMSSVKSFNVSEEKAGF